MEFFQEDGDISQEDELWWYQLHGWYQRPTCVWTSPLEFSNLFFFSCEFWATFSKAFCVVLGVPHLRTGLEGLGCVAGENGHLRQKKLAATALWKTHATIFIRLEPWFDTREENLLSFSKRYQRMKRATARYKLQRLVATFSFSCGFLLGFLSRVCPRNGISLPSKWDKTLDSLSTCEQTPRSSEVSWRKNHLKIGDGQISPDEISEALANPNFEMPQALAGKEVPKYWTYHLNLFEMCFGVSLSSLHTLWWWLFRIQMYLELQSSDPFCRVLRPANPS